MISRENISLSKAGISMSVRNEAKVNSNTQRFIVYFGRSYFLVMELHLISLEEVKGNYGCLPFTKRFWKSG